MRSPRAGSRCAPGATGPTRPLSYNGLVWVLTNKFYAGIVEWNGAEYPGRHQPLVDMETFNRVQELFAARTGREARESRHRHFLKGHLVCGVCGRRLSLQKSKGRYLYYFCLGQKDRRKPTGCRERYVAAADLERQVEELYAKIQLSPGMAQDLHAALEAELVEQQDRNAADRDLQTKRLTVLEGQRRKLLEAYYAGAIDVAMLREEQDRIGRETRQAEELLKSADAGLAEWQSVLDLAMRLAPTPTDWLTTGSSGSSTRQCSRRSWSGTATSRRPDTRPPSGYFLRPSSNVPVWSGRRASNPLPQPWQGCALPSELLPPAGDPNGSEMPGAGDGNRTRINSLEGCRTAIVLHPPILGPPDPSEIGPPQARTRIRFTPRGGRGRGADGAEAAGVQGEWQYAGVHDRPAPAVPPPAVGVSRPYS